MKKLKFYFIVMCLLLNTSLFSKSWANNLINTLDFDSFLNSISFETKVLNCGINDLKDSLAGVKIHHQDPFLFTESVREKGLVLFMDTNILKTKGKSSKGKSSVENFANILGTGTNRNGDGKLYVNMLQISILDLISEAMSLEGIACFHPAKRMFFYSSAIDPTATDFMQFYMLMDVVSMMNLNGIFAMIFDSIAYESFSRIDDKESETGQYLKKTINSYGYSLGSNGGITLGASNQSSSPLVNGLASSFSLIKILSRTGYAILQSQESPLNAGQNVLCQQLKGPVIKTQFVPQMLLPIASGQFELGITPARWASFKDNQQTRGDTAILWWVRKDFVAFAGNCIW